MLRIKIKNSDTTQIINANCNGQFIEHLGGCVYDGVWVGKDSAIPNIDGIRLDTIEALKNIGAPIIRWPGGLFADNYHWRDGIGPAEKRPIRQNLGWNSIESNQFGTHEFMHLCELIDAEPYICLNLGSGTVEESRAWVEYCNSNLSTSITRERAANGHKNPFNVKFWGLGNEPGYPLDGMMRTAYYADIARHYAGYVKHFASQSVYKGDARFHESGVKIILADNRSAIDFCADSRNEYLDLIAVHIYRGMEIESSTDAEVRYRRIMSSLPRITEEIQSACILASQLSTEQHSVNVAVDEWGIWHNGATPLNGLRQSTSLGDALFAASFLHMIYAEEKVSMANIAQTANVLHALILTDKENFCLTPTYHVFDMLKNHLNEERLAVEIQEDNIGKKGTVEEKCMSINLAATRSAKGKICLTSCNPELNLEQEVSCEVSELQNFNLDSQLLTAQGIADQNSFNNPDYVRPVPFKDINIAGNTITFKHPPKSVIQLELIPVG